MYNEALTKRGFNDDIIYTLVVENSNSEKNKTMKRKIIWFNPPYSMNVETDIGKTFLKLVKKSFSHAFYHEIFNKNTIKISYSCMKNISIT